MTSPQDVIERVRDLTDEVHDYATPLCVPENTREAQLADYCLQLIAALAEIESYVRELERERDGLTEALREYAAKPGGLLRLIRKRDAAEAEVARLREGLAEVRLRHMYGAKQAGEALAVWVLNGNEVAEWKPRSTDFGYESEGEYQARQKLNARLAALAADDSGEEK